MLIPIILPFLFLILQKSNKIRFFYIGAVLLFLISAFRSIEVGTDTLNRFASYGYSMTNDFSVLWNQYVTTEPIYATILFFCNKAHLSFKIFETILALLFFIPLVFSLKRVVDKPVASLLFLLLLGYYYMSLNITRQCISMSFCLLAYCLLSEKNYLWSIVFLLVAVGFHSSAIIAAIVFALPFVNLNKNIIIVVLIASYLIPHLFSLSNIITIIFGSITSFASYELYIEEDFLALDRLPIYNTLRTAMFIYIALITEEKDKSLFFKIALMSVAFSNLLFGVPSYVGRINYYFEFVLIVFFAQWGYKYKKTYWIPLVYGFIYYTHHYILQHQEGIYPFVLDF